MSALIRVTLSASAFQVKPGQEADFQVTVQNFSEVVDRYTIQVTGIVPEWVVLSRAELPLFPKDEDKVRVTLRLPESSNARAGRYDFQVQVVSNENPAERTVVAGVLEVLATPRFAISLAPQRQQSQGEGLFRLHIANQGNADLTFELGASDPAEACAYAFQPAQPVAPAGQTHTVRVTVTPKLLPAPGTAKAHEFAVHVQPAGQPQQAQVLSGMLEVSTPALKQRPKWIPWAIGLGILFVLCMVLGVAFAALGGPEFVAGLLRRETPVVETVVPTRVTQITPTFTPTEPPTEPPTEEIDPNLDTDNDGISDAQEKLLGTNPNKADTDGDGLPDGEEATAGTSPLLADTDGDQLSDAQETLLGADPLNPDTDGDGIPDGEEQALGTNPAVADTDGDGLDDGVELAAGTNSLNADSDSDGVNDKDEQLAGTDPLNPDTDGDGLTDGQERVKGTNPLITDTDGDGQSDSVDPNPVEAADVQPPVVSLTISPDKPTRVDKITFTAAASDNQALSRIQMFINGSVAKECAASPCVYEGGPYPNDASLIYAARAFDAAGNQAATGDQNLNIASAMLFDFIERANGASWGSGAGNLPWPGANNDNRGFALWLENVELENGNTVDRALEMHPEWVDSGIINGIYTAPFYENYVVQESDVFVATVGLLKNAGNGNVTFKVMIRVEGAGNSWIAEVNDTYDGKLQSINVSLSPWAGKRADFILTVEAGGSSSQDWAVWTNAKIWRGNPPLFLLTPIRVLPIQPIRP